MHAHPAAGVEVQEARAEPAEASQAWTPPQAWSIVQPTADQQRALDDLYATLTATDPLSGEGRGASA